MAEEEAGHVLAQFRSEDGENSGAPFDLPLSVTTEHLQSVCNDILENEEPVPYSFFVGDDEIKGSLGDWYSKQKDKVDTEKAITIVYQPQAVFRVRPVTRCTSSMPGHSEAVISVAFSPDGRHLASGSGDTTVRFWDIFTETPHHTCKGHSHWILYMAWSPNGKVVASGCKNSEIRLWNPLNGQQAGRPLVGHRQWITCLAWQPLHKDGQCRYLASASKDGDIRIWNTSISKCERILSSHTKSVACIRWGGEGLLYSASQDRTIKVWRAEDGTMCRTLQGHGHWVNTMALNTDYAIRTGAYDPGKPQKVAVAEATAEELTALAEERYDNAKAGGKELMVSGSDDYTLFLWEPANDKKPIARMTGHQQLINDVRFSPDTRFIASASFDKSVKLWEGRTGKFIATLRGHVNAVYQVAWSADSRLLCSGSRDSTLKVWDIRERTLLMDLPGHADEVFAVDWSPDGERVASGGKDKVLKVWRT
ncbi:notchless protein homolog 1-like [Sycon ciliatum]|uniref:notchless protein homolog 1-like n=1 Tax=Sycon ciliatum TaxID=27933 RepID=UPI0020AC05E1|eukprot:scpid71603/ scgid19610/ Notchless protein homolog 1